jgi:hypothetical protein
MKANPLTLILLFLFLCVLCEGASQSFPTNTSTIPAITNSTTKTNALAGSETSTVTHESPTNSASMMEIKTSDGEIYKSVRIIKVEPDGILVNYIPEVGGIGIAKLRFRKLPVELRKLYAYDSEKAAAFEHQQARATRQWRSEMLAAEALAQALRTKQEKEDTQQAVDLPRQESQTTVAAGVSLAPGGGGIEQVTILAVQDSDYKAIIRRRNGELYLIEYGVGVLSIWRFEGKPAIIHSPGLFLGIGSKIVLPGADQSARIWASQQIND